MISGNFEDLLAATPINFNQDDIVATIKNDTSEPGTALINVATMRHIIQLAGSDFETFFETVAIESAKLISADGAALVVEDTNGMMRYKFFYGLPESFQKNILGYRLQANSGTIGQAIKLKQAIFTADYAASPHAVRQFVDLGLKANLIIPINLHNHDHPVAILVISWFNSYPTEMPDAAHLEIINLYCDLLDAGLSRQTMLDDWKLQANRDALTGLPNRRALMEYLPLALARSRRNGTSVLVCVMDLDDFKPVNDTYGHAAGDTLLMDLAHRLKTVLRATDMVARLGGDEFVLVLEDIESITHMELMLVRIHAAVKQPFELLSGQLVNVDMSLGVTLFPNDDATPDYLLRHADNALYIIKEQKATRSVCWNLWQPPAALLSGKD